MGRPSDTWCEGDRAVGELTDASTEVTDMSAEMRAMLAEFRLDEDEEASLH